jgi:hypothetical protein
VVLGRADPVHGIRPEPAALVRFVRAVRAAAIGIVPSLTG